MNASPSDFVLPIVIVPLDGGKRENSRREEPPDLRHWQIEELYNAKLNGLFPNFGEQ